MISRNSSMSNLQWQNGHLMKSDEPDIVHEPRRRKSISFFGAVKMLFGGGAREEDLEEDESRGRRNTLGDKLKRRSRSITRFFSSQA
jgi:hypothetical protein